MSRRLFWVDDNAIHNGPDHEGYWLIDGGGYEATELQAIAAAWVDHTRAMGEGPFRDTQSKLHALLDALTEETR